MSEFITAHTYPAHYAAVVGDHRLVGWGSYDTLADSIKMRTFGYMVRAAMPVVKEYHGDLMIDADTLRKTLDDVLSVPENGSARFLYCVRHSGTGMGAIAQHMYESHAYDAALYTFEVYAKGQGEWYLRIDLIDARPDRPEVHTSSTDGILPPLSAQSLGLTPIPGQ